MQDRKSDSGSHSSTILVVVENPVITRMRSLVTEMIAFSSQAPGSERVGRMSFILQSVVDEIMEELEDLDDIEQTRRYLAWCGLMLQWVATGQTDALPEQLRAFACKLTGERFLTDEEMREDVKQATAISAPQYMGGAVPV
jgi:hypothetical protein